MEVYNVGRRGERSQRHTLSIVLVIFTLASLSLSVITLVIYQRQQRENTSPICVPCSLIEPTERADISSRELYAKLVRRTDANGQEILCCATNSKNSKALLQLLSKTLEKKQTNTNALAMRNKMKNSIKNSFAYAQKTLLEPSNQDKKGKMTILPINDSELDPIYEVKKEVGICRDGINVSHPGLYFVYTSINFNPDSNTDCVALKDQVIISELVLKRVNNDPKVIATSEQPCCVDCDVTSETGFTGGLFELEEGDLIQVQVSASNLIYPTKDATFVGLMMLGYSQSDQQK